MRKVLPFTLCCVLMGCASSMAWTKPGADQAATQRDLLDCRSAAFVQAQQYYRAYAGPLTDHRYWLAWYDPEANSDRFMREDTLARACMRERGYAWTTVAPAT